jgi:non-specific serine/threonine protein kinase
VIQAAEAWVEYAEGRPDTAVTMVKAALAVDPDIEGGYELLGRALFESGRYQEVVDVMEEAIAHSSENYNVWVPIGNALSALGKKDAHANYLHREIAVFQEQLKKVPEDARARVLLAGCYGMQGRLEDAKREADMAMALRPNDTMILYNTACVFGTINNAKDALIALRKAKDAGYTNPAWVRKDPDLAILHGDPEFEQLYPANAEAA